MSKIAGPLAQGVLDPLSLGVGASFSLVSLISGAPQGPWPAKGAGPTSPLPLPPPRADLPRGRGKLFLGFLGA